MTRAEHRKFFRKWRAFSLVEILVVIVIAIVLILMISQGWNRTLQIAVSNVCLANLRILHASLNNYAADHNSCYPPGQDSKKVTWLSKVADYLPPADTAGKKKVGITYCPASGVDKPYPFNRDAGTWRTDYNINGNIASATESQNNLASMRPSLLLLYDGGGGAAGTVAGNSKARDRHDGHINVIFVDGHTKSPTTNAFSNDYEYTNAWKK